MTLRVVDTPVTDVDLASVQRSLNKMLAPGVVVRALDLAPEGFDARRSAVGRRYRYTVLNRLVPDPFHRAPRCFFFAGSSILQRCRAAAAAEEMVCLQLRPVASALPS